MQSVWLKGSFKNCKALYFSHGYREHTSAMGDTINNQKEYLNILLSQWEAATEHNQEEILQELCGRRVPDRFILC